MSVATPPKGETRIRVDRPLQLGMPGFEIGPEDTVVDVGCGDGTCCQFAGSMGAAVIGIDVEPILVNRANQAMRNIPARSWKGIVSHCDPIPVPDAWASVVICTEVMEHVDDPDQFAAELVRIGKPGARYLISVPDPTSETLMQQVAPSWYWQRPFHLRIFQHEQLDALLADVGLTVERREQGGSYHSFRWLLLMALGPKPGDHVENYPLMKIWDEIWRILMASQEGPRLLHGLDRALPKSQIVLASKSGGSGTARRHRDLASPLAWKHRLRSGSMQLGGLKLTWDLRKTRRSLDR